MSEPRQGLLIESRSAVDETDEGVRPCGQDERFSSLEQELDAAAVIGRRKRNRADGLAGGDVSESDDVRFNKNDDLGIRGMSKDFTKSRVAAGMVRGRLLSSENVKR